MIWFYFEQIRSGTVLLCSTPIHTRWTYTISIIHPMMMNIHPTKFPPEEYIRDSYPTMEWSSSLSCVCINRASSHLASGPPRRSVITHDCTHHRVCAVCVPLYHVYIRERMMRNARDSKVLCVPHSQPADVAPLAHTTSLLTSWLLLFFFFSLLSLLNKKDIIYIYIYYDPRQQYNIIV